MQLYYPFHKCSMFISYFEYLAPFIYFCISTTVQQHNRYLPLSLIFIDLCLAKAVHFHLANCKGNDWLIWLSKHVELRYIIWLNVNVKNESEMNYLKKKKSFSIWISLYRIALKWFLVLFCMYMCQAKTYAAMLLNR